MRIARGDNFNGVGQGPKSPMIYEFAPLTPEPVMAIFAISSAAQDPVSVFGKPSATS